MGLGWVTIQAPAKAAPRVIDEGLVLLFGSLVGSRAGHIWAHWSYYQSHLPEIPQVWLGGLSAAGGLAGALISLFILSALTRQAVGLLADRYLPLAALVAIAGWLVSWWSGSAYGPLAEGRWWGLPARDESGLYAFRFPIQLLEAAFSLVIFWLLDRLRITDPQQSRYGWKAYLVQGQATAWWFLALSLQLLVLGFVRVDPGLTWRGLRVDIWAAGGLCLAAIFLLTLLYWYSPSMRLRNGSR